VITIVFSVTSVLTLSEISPSTLSVAIIFKLLIFPFGQTLNLSELISNFGASLSTTEIFCFNFFVLPLYL